MKTVKVRTKIGMEEVAAKCIHGVLAVTSEFSPYKWSVTHIPSGTVFVGCRKLAVARAVAKSLGETAALAELTADGNGRAPTAWCEKNRNIVHYIRNMHYADTAMTYEEFCAQANELEA